MKARILMTGNDAVGEGAIRAGCQAFFGYPITPQNELTAYMARHMPEHGRIFLQAESEVAAINMVYGVAAAGGRAMTSSSSPGISLKQEGISYLAACELPAMVVNVQRGGPGLGNIAPAQGDYFQAVKGGGHGDYHMIVLAPDSVQEMHDLTILGFDLADRYRTPVMLLADGRLGQMMEPLHLHEGPPPRVPAKTWALTGARDRDARSIRSLFLEEGLLEQLNLRLQEKYRGIVRTEIRYEERDTRDADVVLVAYGTCARIAKGVQAAARAQGLRVGLLRPITLWPFPAAAIAHATARARGVVVIEMSAGQMLEDVELACQGRVPVRLVGRMGGGVPEEGAIHRAIAAVLRAPGRPAPRRRAIRRRRTP